MADSFTLKGARTVVGNKGTAVRVSPSRGGDTHKFPKWWSLKNRVMYIDTAIFKVTLDDGTVVNLVIPIQENTEVKVVHDGYGNFTFPQSRGVDRIAVVSAADKSLYREYQFPSISKGPILTNSGSA